MNISIVCFYKGTQEELSKENFQHFYVGVNLEQSLCNFPQIREKLLEFESSERSTPMLLLFAAFRPFKIWWFQGHYSEICLTFGKSKMSEFKSDLKKQEQTFLMFFSFHYTPLDFVKCGKCFGTPHRFMNVFLKFGSSSGNVCCFLS